MSSLRRPLLALVAGQALAAADLAPVYPGDAWEVVTRSGTNRTGVDAVEWCARCEQLGAGEILLTSWDRDGTRTGYDLELLRATAGRVALPVIASGGVNDPGHLAEGVEAGATGVLAASIFHDDDWTVEGVKRAMGSAAGARLPSLVIFDASRASWAYVRNSSYVRDDVWSGPGAPRSWVMCFSSAHAPATTAIAPVATSRV